MSDRQPTRRRAILAGAMLLGLAGCTTAIDAPPSSVVFFSNESIVLDAAARGVIAEVVQDAKDHPSTRILVKGFADAAAAGARAPGIAQRRAEVVSNELVTLGIDRGRVSQVPRGAHASDPGIESRRVEIQLVR